jgi:hypothetical protein
MSERNTQTTTATGSRVGIRDEETRTDDRMPESGQSAGRSTADMAAAMKQSSGKTETAAPRSPDSGTAQLFAGDESEKFHSRWTDIQTGFVDEPRHAVEEADGLVAEVIQRLAQTFADERSKLEQQWGKGDDVSTEDLRVALQRYRSFFERLLAA